MPACQASPSHRHPATVSPPPSTRMAAHAGYGHQASPDGGTDAATTCPESLAAPASQHSQAPESSPSHRHPATVGPAPPRWSIAELALGLIGPGSRLAAHPRQSTHPHLDAVRVVRREVDFQRLPFDPSRANPTHASISMGVRLPPSLGTSVSSQAPSLFRLHEKTDLARLELAPHACSTHRVRGPIFEVGSGWRAAQ